MKKPEESNESLLKLSEVEAELSLSRITLLRWIKSGKMPAVKIGQQWRVRRRVVDALKDGHEATGSDA